MVSAYEVEIPIGDSTQTFTLPSYIVTVHKFAVILAAILAVIFMMIGGFLWLSSAGNSGMVSTGQNFIKGSIIGLILTLFSWYILYAINPNLVKLSITEPTITIPWCCQDNTTGLYSLSTEINSQSCSKTSTKAEDSLCEQLIICCQSTSTSEYFKSLISCPPTSKPAETKYCSEGMTEGGSCQNSNKCAPPLICNSVFNECMTGGEGIQCGNDSDCDQTIAPKCASSSTGHAICQTGTTGSQCDSNKANNECLDNFYCVSGTCQDGMTNAPCDDSYDCDEDHYCNTSGINECAPLESTSCEDMPDEIACSKRSECIWDTGDGAWNFEGCCDLIDIDANGHC